MLLRLNFNKLSSITEHMRLMRYSVDQPMEHIARLLSMFSHVNGPAQAVEVALQKYLHSLHVLMSRDGSSKRYQRQSVVFGNFQLPFAAAVDKTKAGSRFVYLEEMFVVFAYVTATLVGSRDHTRLLISCALASWEVRVDVGTARAVKELATCWHVVVYLVGEMSSTNCWDIVFQGINRKMLHILPIPCRHAAFWLAVRHTLHRTLLSLHPQYPAKASYGGIQSAMIAENDQYFEEQGKAGQLGLPGLANIGVHIVALSALKTTTDGLAYCRNDLPSVPSFFQRLVYAGWVLCKTPDKAKAGAHVVQQSYMPIAQLGSHLLPQIMRLPPDDEETINTYIEVVKSAMLHCALSGGQRSVWTHGCLLMLVKGFRKALDQCNAMDLSTQALIRLLAKVTETPKEEGSLTTVDTVKAGTRGGMDFNHSSGLGTAFWHCFIAAGVHEAVSDVQLFVEQQLGQGVGGPPGNLTPSKGITPEEAKLVDMWLFLQSCAVFLYNPLQVDVASADVVADSSLVEAMYDAAVLWDSVTRTCRRGAHLVRFRKAEK